MKSTATAVARRARKAARTTSSSLLLPGRQRDPAARTRVSERFGGRARRRAAPPVIKSAPPEAAAEASQRDGDSAPRLVAARAGDHAAIHGLLVSIFHGPSAAEFHAQLEEPLYEPTDRLLVKSGEWVVAHLRLTKRVIRFGELTIPTAGFMDLATSHEFRSRGFASALLDAGQQQAMAEGALVGLTRTTVPGLFLRQGWSVCGRHSFSVAGPRQILAHFCRHYPHDEPATLPDDGDAPGILAPIVEPMVVRPLRRIELPAIIRLYEQMFARSYGVQMRTDVWWDWLMARGAFDRAYVAIARSDQLELPQLLAAVMGCVFVKEGRIVELLCVPRQERVARRLVARVCADAVERNLAGVRLDAPPHDPLHQQWADAGGTTHLAATHQGETYMARIFDPLTMLRLLAGTLLARAKAAELPRPLALGLDVYHHDADLTQSRREDVRSYRLVVGKRGVKLASGNPGRSYLSLRRRDLTPLLLGHWDVAEALAAGRVRASTRLAQEAAAILFPPLPWYRPPLDELIA